jgi:hypothetical protein
MANKFDGDVRPLSNDQRYMGVVFQGLIDDAIQQAHAAPDHGFAEQPVHPSSISRDRWNLLEHLNLAPHYSAAKVVARHRELMIQMAGDRIDFENEAERDSDAAFIRGSDALLAAAESGKFTLAYAMKHFPESFYRGPDANQSVADRLNNLDYRQMNIYWQARLTRGIRESLDYAEQYPYPVVQS